VSQDGSYREDQRVGVWHPAEARRLNSAAHGDAVGEHDVDTDAVQHPSGVSVALLPLDLRLAIDTAEQPTRRLRGGGCIRSQVHRIGGWLHVVNRQRVELAIRRPFEDVAHGVRVIVDGRRFLNFGGNLRVGRALP